jgi:hypothetical protein
MRTCAAGDGDRTALDCICLCKQSCNRGEPARRIGVGLSGIQSVRSEYAVVKRQCAFLSSPEQLAQ